MLNSLGEDEFRYKEISLNRTERRKVLSLSLVTVMLVVVLVGVLLVSDGPAVDDASNSFLFIPLLILSLDAKYKEERWKVLSLTSASVSASESSSNKGRWKVSSLVVVLVVVDDSVDSVSVR